jgi:hypothetical protein
MLVEEKVRPAGSSRRLGHRAKALALSIRLFGWRARSQAAWSYWEFSEGANRTSGR